MISFRITRRPSSYSVCFRRAWPKQAQGAATGLPAKRSWAKNDYIRVRQSCGEPVVRVLQAMLHQATFAVLDRTAEDKTAEASKRARQNVIHEAGLFQGQLGFPRAILLQQNLSKIFERGRTSIHRVR